MKIEEWLKTQIQEIKEEINHATVNSYIPMTQVYLLKGQKIGLEKVLSKLERQNDGTINTKATTSVANDKKLFL